MQTDEKWEKMQNNKNVAALMAPSWWGVLQERGEWEIGNRG